MIIIGTNRRSPPIIINPIEIIFGEIKFLGEIGGVTVVV